MKERVLKFAMHIFEDEPKEKRKRLVKEISSHESLVEDLKVELKCGETTAFDLILDLFDFRDMCKQYLEKYPE